MRNNFRIWFNFDGREICVGTSNVNAIGKVTGFTDCKSVEGCIKRTAELNNRQQMVIDQSLPANGDQITIEPVRPPMVPRIPDIDLMSVISINS